MSNFVKPISTTLLRRGMGKSSRPHQASDPQPLSRQSPTGLQSKPSRVLATLCANALWTLVLRTVRRKAQTKALAACNARDWGLGESSPNMDIVFKDKFCTLEKGIKCFV
ncbi:MAG: hypothetical protein AAGM29_04660 [Cyanobacteria bacterium J06588_4]